MLTDAAWGRLRNIAKLKNTSISELIEKWAREYDGE